MGDSATGIVDSMGRSALHFACFDSNETVLKCLLKAGFKMDVVDIQGKLL